MNRRRAGSASGGRQRRSRGAPRERALALEPTPAGEPWQALARALAGCLRCACVVETLALDGVPRLAAAATDGDDSGALAELRALHPPLVDDPAGLGRVLDTGVAVLFETPPASVLHPVVARHLALPAALCLPVSDETGVVAIVTLLGPDAASWLDGDRRSVIDVLARQAQARARAERLLDDARRALDLRDDVLATAAHDLSSPLGAVLLSAEALRRSLIDPPPLAAKALETMARAARQMQRLVSDIGSLAALSRGTLALAPAPTEVAPLLREAIVDLAPVLQRRRLRVDTVIPAGAMYLLADRPSTLQVLRSLIDEAARRCPAGGAVRVEAALLGASVRMRVSETSSSTRAAEEAAPWESRLPAEPIRRGGGRSLGVHLGQGLIEAQRGRLWIEPGPDGRPVTTLILPAAIRAEAEPAGASACPPGPAPNALVPEAPAPPLVRRKGRGAPAPSRAR